MGGRCDDSFLEGVRSECDQDTSILYKYEILKEIKYIKLEITSKQGAEERHAGQNKSMQRHKNRGNLPQRK